MAPLNAVNGGCFCDLACITRSGSFWDSKQSLEICVERAMGYYTTGVGKFCYAEVHDSIHDHYTEKGYRPWGRFRDGEVLDKDYQWDISLFLDASGELLDVGDVLRRWMFGYVFGKYGRFYCLLWLGEGGIYLQSPIGDADYRMGVSRVWHEVSSWEQYQWLLDSGQKWQWECVLVVPAKTEK